MLLTAKKNRVFSCTLLLLFFSCLASPWTWAQKVNSPSAGPGSSSGSGSGYFTIENYYKVKWGFADEFINLWKNNHYPLLKKAQEKGDIISIAAARPQLHSGEDTRWDFKVTIVFKTVELAFAPDLVSPYKPQLYPDAGKLAKEEQHRFELLIAHWDVPVETVKLD